MAVFVVYFLKPVQIKSHQTEGMRIAARPIEFLVERFIEEPTVVQAGKRIGDGPDQVVAAHLIVERQIDPVLPQRRARANRALIDDIKTEGNRPACRGGRGSVDQLHLQIRASRQADQERIGIDGRVVAAPLVFIKCAVSIRCDDNLEQPLKRGGQCELFGARV